MKEYWPVLFGGKNIKKREEKRQQCERKRESKEMSGRK
jgi:hypothetical protein